MKLALLTTLVALVLAAPAAARKPPSISPPGNSGVDEYSESIPSAGGGTPTRGLPPNSKHPHHTAALSPSAQRSLDSRGSDGRKVAALIAATAPTGGGGGSSNNGGAQTTGTRKRTGHHKHGRDGRSGGTASHRSRPAPPLADDPGASPAGAVAKAIGGGGGGMGLLLPAILIAALVAGVLSALLRRAKNQDSTEA